MLTVAILAQNLLSAAAMDEKKCCVRSCPWSAMSRRAQYCWECFLSNASRSGLKSGGGVLGNAGGHGQKGNAGGHGKKGNAGNASAHGRKGNIGNVHKGITKEKAGARSGLKRATKNLLIVKNPWMEKILSRTKTWEIRGTSTQKRGLTHLGLSGSGGKILGCARLIDCLPLSREELCAQADKHCIEDCNIVRYREIYAWALKDARRHEQPLRCTHVKGATTWIKL